MYRIKSNIRQLRLMKGLPVYRFAAGVGVTPKVVADWERGRRNPNIYHAMCIADVLGCTLNDLGFEVVDDDNDDDC